MSTLALAQETLALTSMRLQYVWVNNSANRCLFVGFGLVFDPGSEHARRVEQGLRPVDKFI